MCTHSSARRYHCARCQRPVLICSHCDRGHIYCFRGCRELAQKERCQRNAKRYQSTHHGRRNNAKRQSEYRKRRQAQLSPVAADSSTNSTSGDEVDTPAGDSGKTKKVTHRGSTITGASVVLQASGNNSSFFNCDCCERACSNYVRIHFLRTRCRYRSAVP